METQEYEKARGNYLALMQIIDEYKIVEYKTTESPTYKGLLYFLKGVVPKLVVTKYGKRLGIEALKAFFCNEILGLNDTSRDFCEYENYFKKGNSDGYLFQTDDLNKFMEDSALRENGIPELLLNKLWTIAHGQLFSYFDKASKDKPNETEKKEMYCRFVMAVALYEIFVMKFLGDTSFARAGEKLDEVEPYLDRAYDLAEKFYGRKGVVPEEEAEAILQELDEVFDKLPALKEGIREATQATAYCRNIRYLAAFSVVIMLIEYRNVTGESKAKKLRQPEQIERLENMFKEEYAYIHIDDVSMNKEKKYTELYAGLVETVEQNRIFQELLGKDWYVQQRTLKLLKEYFHMVKTSSMKDKEGNEKEEFSKMVTKIAMKCMEK